MAERQTSVLNLVISTKVRVARFTSTLSVLLSHEIHKKNLYWRKVFHRETAHAYPNHRFKPCGGPEAFTSTTNPKQCGGETRSGGKERYILKTDQELPYLTKYVQLIHT